MRSAVSLYCNSGMSVFWFVSFLSSVGDAWSVPAGCLSGFSLFGFPSTVFLSILGLLKLFGSSLLGLGVIGVRFPWGLVDDQVVLGISFKRSCGGRGFYSRLNLVPLVVFCIPFMSNEFASPNVVAGLFAGTCTGASQGLVVFGLRHTVTSSSFQL